MAQENRIDWFMFGIAAVLALFGAMMVYSASAMFALKETESNSQYTYFYKQIGFTLVGLGGDVYRQPDRLPHFSKDVGRLFDCWRDGRFAGGGIRIS